MRIIIIGEFSSFAKNLSLGFRENGHECFVFSWGDGFKKVTQDKQNSYSVLQDCKNYRPHILSLVIHFFESWRESWKLKKFVNNIIKEDKWDVVLIINPGFIRQQYHFWQPLFTKQMILNLVYDPNNVFLSACGGDLPYYDYWNEHEWKNRDIIKLGRDKYLSKMMVWHHNYYSSFINKVIPVMYGYAQAWRNSQYSKSYQVLETIPLPVDCSGYVINNIINNKILVFHGIIRPEAKGTKYIKAAMDKIQQNYPDLVECKAEGGLPLEDYLKILNSANILIDQALADSVGMNGLYALAMGKVVIGGNEFENQKEYNEFDCPIINIGPDSDDIYKKLEELILHPEMISAISKKSIEYVRKVHDSSVVAKKYTDLFSLYLHE